MKTHNSRFEVINREEIIFNCVQFLSKTLVKLIKDDYELKTSQRRHSSRYIARNYLKRLLLDGTENDTTIIAVLVVK